MKVQIPTKSLAETLQRVERIVPTRSSNPGLTLIRLELLDDALRFSGSNLDLDIEATVAADVRGDGTYALPAQVFSQVIRALPGDTVDLEAEDNELGVSSAAFATKLQLVDPESAPRVTFPDTYSGSLPGGALAEALGSVRYAAAVAEYQAIFRGVKLELSDAGSRAVATDGFRLAYRDMEHVSGLSAEMVVPARSVDEMIRIVGDGPAELEPGDGQVSVRCGAYRVNVKLMEGTFPDYRRVIPSSFPVTVTMNAAAFAEAVERVAVMADKTANNRVDLFIREGVLQITAEGAYGRSQEALEVRQEGTDSQMALAYNAKYLTDALHPIQGELRVQFSGPTSPSVLVDPDEPSYLAMVVPLRTG